MCNDDCSKRNEKLYGIKYEKTEKGRSFVHNFETDDPIEFDAHLCELIRGPDDGRIVKVRIGGRTAFLCWLPAGE